MKILFDQGTPVPLRNYLAGHEISTAYELGWSQLSNGDLLSKADGQFDVLVTTDRNLKYQQNLATRVVAICVLPTTNWRILERHARQIGDSISQLKPGAYYEIQLA